MTERPEALRLADAIDPLTVVVTVVLKLLEMAP